MRIIPLTLRQANAFVDNHHRHSRATRGHKFSIGLQHEGELVGVAIAGRPVARALDDGLTIEVNRTCTLGAKNANSMLYGAVWRAAKAMGYERAVTYTQADESGVSLRAAGWTPVAELKPRKNWAESSSGRLKAMRDPGGPGGVKRIRWEQTC